MGEVWTDPCDRLCSDAGGRDPASVDSGRRLGRVRIRARPLARSLRIVALVAIALAATPPRSIAMDRHQAHHLLSRAGFAPSLIQLDMVSPLSQEKAVQWLLDGARSEPVTAPPDWTRAVPQWPQDPVDDQPSMAARIAESRVRELQDWWLAEMAVTPSPLTERMTLFWHSHFTTSARKVPVPQLLYRQNALFRRHALGNFARLLHEIARDPAMMLYLDIAGSRKGRPNENFAREVMELFTLGEANYTEADIKAAARAFTGWVRAPESAQIRFDPASYDDGLKTFRGRTGRFDGAAIIDILLEEPQTARFITEKLWRWFISEQPEPEAVRRFARLFRASGYEIKPLLFAMLTSEAFLAPAARGRIIRSPVELVVGTIRALGLGTGGGLSMRAYTRRFGQVLFEPPDVKGWRGGTDWITPASIADREAFAEHAWRVWQVGLVKPKRKAKMARLHARRAERMSPDQPLSNDEIAGLAAWLLPAAPIVVPEAGMSLVEATRILMADPLYQLQ